MKAGVGVDVMVVWWGCAWPLGCGVVLVLVLVLPFRSGCFLVLPGV